MEDVYIIWHEGVEAITQRIIRVGKGIIRDRLKAHREDKEVLAYEPKGLYVTWGSVAANSCDGVEKYLADTLNPKAGERFHD